MQKQTVKNYFELIRHLFPLLSDGGQTESFDKYAMYMYIYVWITDISDDQVGDLEEQIILFWPDRGRHHPPFVNWLILN